MKVMITENIDVKNGICNGTTGYITEIIKNENEKYVINVLTNDNKKINITTLILLSDDIKINNQTYSIRNEFMPIKQCNAITIHKSQGQTYNEKVILDCNKIFENSMFYTAISRISDPKNMKIINFKEEYIKCDMTAFNYETKGEYTSYFEKMLIANDEDKLNSLKVKSDVNMLEKTQLYMILNVQQKRIWGMFHILIT
jgi:hypothetical protein